MTSKANRVICPACEEYITLKTAVDIDSKVRCPHCYTDLVVVQMNPIELDWDEYEDDDDWDDDDDFGLDDDEDDSDY